MYLDVDITSVQTEDFNRMGGDVYLASNGDSPLQWLAGAEYQTFTSDVKKHNEGIAPGVPMTLVKKCTLWRSLVAWIML